MNPSRSTQYAYLATRVLDTPLWAIYNMLPFILLKDLGATPFQLALVIALKPIVSIFSTYWSVLINERPDRLRSNIIVARFLGCALFFLYPFFRTPWFFILSSAVYMTLAVGVVPAWMEVLKRNLSDSKRKETFAWGSAMGYLGGGLLPIIFGWSLDSSPHLWQWIFPLAGTISLLATFFQLQLPKGERGEVTEGVEKASAQLIRPWKSAWQLLRERSDFAKYQVAFMVIGGGLMLIQPALYLFFDQKLGLSYVEFAVALSLCKGVSYALASPMWARWMNEVDIFRFSSAVTSLACLFPLLLLLSPQHISWLYVAYIVYGVTQAGSELSWNMSGPFFAGDQDSSKFTSVNVVTVGIRGMIFPALGSILCGLVGPSFVMVVGSSALLLATWLLISYGSLFNVEEKLG